MSRSRRIAALIISLAALTIGSVIGSTGVAAAAKSRPRPNPAVEIGTARVTQLGTVLVRGNGHVLYMFEPLGVGIVCNAACQKIWPPLVAPRKGVAKAIHGAKQSLIGSIRNPVDGKRIVTYAGLPLYTYVLDKLRHEASGQNVLLNGGYWWVLTPAGKINRTPVSHGGGYVGS